jgi:hypothetical protein
LIRRARSRHAKAVQSITVVAGGLAGQSLSQIAAELDIVVELFDLILKVIRRAMHAMPRNKDGAARSVRALGR